MDTGVAIAARTGRRGAAHGHPDPCDPAVSIRSPRSGRVVRLSVTYDRRYRPPVPGPGEQALVGHSRALLLPRQAAQGAPSGWWCGEGRLVSDIVATNQARPSGAADAVARDRF